MEAFTIFFQENPLATAFGVAALLLQLTWPLFRAHKAIMSMQLGIGVDYSLHYALLDAWSGAGVAGLSAMQSAMAIFIGDRFWFRWVGFAFLPILAGICWATWSGLPTLLVFAFVGLIMIGRLQRDTLRLRILLLSATPFGMGHDILIGATPALIGGFVSATIATVMLVREIQSRRQFIKTL